MEFCLIADTISVCTAKQGIAFGKSLLNRWEHISFADCPVDQAPALSFPSMQSLRRYNPALLRQSAGSAKSGARSAFRSAAIRKREEILVGLY
uniref:Uncharacterized protein n=1 Tax=Brassica campestris TaxID=3711 RepID=A0A3P6A8K1_BRACM|nr:unnamed protein product [Brassica rapa]